MTVSCKAVLSAIKELADRMSSRAVNMIFFKGFIVARTEMRSEPCLLNKIEG
jgi:hypothetical protein